MNRLTTTAGHNDPDPTVTLSQLPVDRAGCCTDPAHMGRPRISPLHLWPVRAAYFAELATPVRAKRPPWIGVLATPSEAATAADAGRPFHPLILTSFRFVAR